jgi:hypothetical protein
LAAGGGGSDPVLLVQALDRMMVTLAFESARDARTIKDAYRAHLDLLVLERYDAIEAALYNGGLARLPEDPLRYNIVPRVEGPSPIGEKDMENQSSYIAARPATIGALLTVAARVESGPIEITSLVRHSEYQETLRLSNGNANTEVPVHTMGLAFDIALVNTPLSRVYEIRDVLEQMREAGDILFIGERQQLVFHVVPHPSRLGHFTNVYWSAMGAPVGELPPGVGTPVVTTDVAALVPDQTIAEEWWAAENTRTDLAVEVAPETVLAARAAREVRRAAYAPLLAGLSGGFAFSLFSVFCQRRSREPKSLKSLLIS